MPPNFRAVDGKKPTKLAAKQRPAGQNRVAADAGLPPALGSPWLTLVLSGLVAAVSYYLYLNAQ